MRHFTPEEANAALADVRPLVEQMVAHRRAHVEALVRQEELGGRIRGNGGGIPPAELPDAAAEGEREARPPAPLIDEGTELGGEGEGNNEGPLALSALRRGG